MFRKLWKLGLIGTGAGFHTEVHHARRYSIVEYEYILMVHYDLLLLLLPPPPPPPPTLSWFFSREAGPLALSSQRRRACT